MNREDYKIHIIGAGISGLIAAKTLENKGYKPIIIEETDSVGGRVKTDIVNGYQLDHGFQVLLDAYPKAKEHLDYASLDLQKFLPGAMVFSEGKSVTIGDPLRDSSLLFPTLFASVGSFSDKLKILRLNSSLKKKSFRNIFESKSITTISYLQKKGFSDKIIQKFFKPFFSGIFLETDLSTSSRMFEFVYKMFGEGFAVIPKSGIGAISEQLKSQLSHTEFIFNSKVKSVTENSITLSNGNSIDTHFTIVTSAANQLISDFNEPETNWKSCYNIYFEAQERKIKKPLIGLISDEDALINNIFFHNSLKTEFSGSKELLSVTVVKKHELSETDLVNRVEDELNSKCNISGLNHLKTYHIKQALPNIKNLAYDISPNKTQIKPNIFLAGDYLLNGSLNAAMISGERAAEGLIMAIEDGLVDDPTTLK